MIFLYNCLTLCLHEKEPVSFEQGLNGKRFAPCKEEIMKILSKYNARFCENLKVLADGIAFMKLY